jgi:predicted DCC family thiol-disulfide oxidoreductase YuxK
MNGTVLFDGICNLCNGLILFTKKRDTSKRFRFVTLQSEEGRGMLLEAGLPETDSDTAIYKKDGQFYLRSSAVLHILKDLGGTWKILYIFIIIPPFIRDFFYRFIAHNRYRLFGKRDNCNING